MQTVYSNYPMVLQRFSTIHNTQEKEIWKLQILALLLTILN